MEQRREDLSTADLAGQPPRDSARPDRVDDVDAGRRDVAPDAAPGRDRQLQEDDRPAEAATADEVGAPATVGTPAAGTTRDGGAAGSASAGPLLASSDAEAFRARWTDVQAGFVDAPREAVERADGLVAELMQHLARTFTDERGKLERQWDRGDDVPTDDLRTAFQRYRSFFERLLTT